MTNTTIVIHSDNPYELSLQSTVLRRKFGCIGTIIDWKRGNGLRSGFLHLTTDAIPGTLKMAASNEGVTVMSLDEALAETDNSIESAALSGLRAAQQLAHTTATNAGWYTDPATGKPITRNVGEVIALMHSELSEALEADRKSLMDDKLPHRKGIEVEFADCIIRILDTGAALGLDVPGAIIEKNRYNRERADHKLANRAAAGGKRY